MKMLKHNHCTRCHRVSLNLTMTNRSDGICTDCKSHSKHSLVEENLLPYWIDDDGTIRLDVPTELQCLREGEKLLIQMISPYVPFVHIRNGTLGIKGHVCSFPQRVQDVCTELPRLPETAHVVKMIRKFKGADGEFGIKSFSIRKSAVLAALRWLTKYNVVYKAEVTIKESNLDWMGDDDEAELPCINLSKEDLEEDDGRNQDMGPAEKQCLAEDLKQTADTEDQLGTCGMHVHDSTPFKSQHDQSVEEELRSMKQADKPGSCTLDWPYVSDSPVSEYDGNEKLYAKAFPWLFPGGHGDYSDFRERNLSVSEWAERMLYFKDGRFATDKMWCFFALNYSTRRRNQTSGRYFVDGFYKDVPQTLDELKEKVRDGDTTFMDKISYYAFRVKGSSAYWRHKKAELYTWINYHVSQGNGLPNFFITLSCAEYFWPDIIRLINERLELAGHPDAVSNPTQTPLVHLCFSNHIWL